MKKTIENFMTLKKMNRVEDFIRSIADDVIEKEVRLAKKHHIFSDNYENTIMCSLFNKTINFLEENYKNVPSFENVSAREFFDYIDLTGYIDFVIIGSVKEQLGIEDEEAEVGCRFDEDVVEEIKNTIKNCFGKFTYESVKKYYGLWATPNHPDADKETVLLTSIVLVLRDFLNWLFDEEEEKIEHDCVFCLFRDEMEDLFEACSWVLEEGVA